MTRMMKAALNETVTMRPDFEQKLASFFEGCKRINAEHLTANNENNDVQWNMTWLKRYVRVEVVHDIGVTSYNYRAWCFVDIETGEVLKAARWKAPAITKIKRGNIFDEHNGLQFMGPHGVAYADAINRTEGGQP
jgi:hypothetical protein